MSAIIARISAVSGEVIARAANGGVRRLKSGDAIFEGETIIAGHDGQAMLKLSDGRNVSVGPGESVSVDAEVAAVHSQPDIGNSAVFTKPAALGKLAKLVKAGGNLDDVIDEEGGTAAGNAGDSSEGHSFIELQRISEAVAGSNVYRIDANALNAPELDREQPGIFDTTPPPVTAELDAGSDTGIIGDAITNDSTPTITGTSEPNATLTVTFPETGEVLTTVAAADGSWSVTPTQPLADGPHKIVVVASDEAGNETTTNVELTVDATPIPAPTVAIVEDANNDGFINRAEASGEADIRVSFDTTKVAVGDTVRVSDGITTKEIVVSAADQSNGYVSTSFPLPADGTLLNVSAQIFDIAGNQSPAATDLAKVDLSALLDVQIKVTEDTNQDGTITAAELNGSVGVDIVLPVDAVAGDLVTITATGNATQTITLNQAQIDAHKVTVELTPPSVKGSTLEVTAQVTDAAGNKSAIASKSVLIDAEAPKLTAQLDPASDSGTKGDNITSDNTPTISGVTDPGATVTVTVPITGETLTTTADDKGNWQITPTQPLPDGSIPVHITATDAAGNPTSTTLPLIIDTTQFNGLAVSLLEDENDDKFINLAELKDNDIDVRVTLPNGAAAGDTLTVTASGNAAQTVTLTAAQIAAGHVDLAFTPTANNTDFVVTASIADAAGNTAGPVSDSARIQLSPPDAPVVTITEDANGDRWINAVELQGSIDVSVGLPSTAAAGDTLITTVNGVTQPEILLTAADIAKGSVSLPGIANPGEGATLTVTAQIRDVANNLGSIGSNDARIDTTPPAVFAQLDPASDSGPQGDNITNDNTPTISGTGEPGASIVVTLPGTGEILKTTVTPGGTWSVTPLQPLADGPAQVKVTATDVAGNSTSTTVDLTIDTGIPNNLQPPSVLIVEDVNGDGYINRSEATGNADVRIGFAKDLVNVGDVVKASDGTTTRDVTITAADKANGYVSTDFPLPADGATLKVSAYIEDAAGNASNTGSASAIVDLTEFKNLTIAIREDENNDGFINQAELKDNDIDVRVTIPQGAAVGDTLTITAVGNVDQVFTLTAAQIAAGSIDVKFNPTFSNTDFKVTASIVDAAGNSAGPVEDSARIINTPPSEPIVTILEDANNDTWINATELQGNIDVSIALPATAVAGDKLLTMVNGVAQAPIVITQADILKGSIALPGIANPGEGVKLTVDAQIQDAAGNIGKTGSDSATIDTRIPNDGDAPTVTLTQDNNPDDGLINTAELGGRDKLGVRIEFVGSKVEVGDTVHVTDGSTTQKITISSTDKANGYVAAEFPAPASGNSIKVDAWIVDPAGNKTDTGSDSAKIDTGTPNDGFAPTVTITEDVNNDGFINRAEANGNADVKIAFTKDKVEVGDTVRVTDGTTTKDLVISAADQANGYVTTDFAMPADGTTLNVSAFLFDPAGNKSGTGSDYAKVDLSTLQGLSLTITEDSNDDRFINANELKGTVGVEIVLPKDAIAGDLITINATGNATQTITLTQPQIDAGKLTVELTAPPNGTRLEVSAQVADAAGNKSNVASDDATIALVSPGAPIVSITEDANNDGYLNAAELQGNIDVSIELPAGAKAGESLLVSINGVAQAAIVLSAADIASGSVNLDFPSPGDGQPFEVSAQVKDSAGNLSPTGIDSATVDTTVFSGLAIAIAEDANDDGFINQAELKDKDIDVRVTIPQGAAVGDTLTVTAVGNVDKVFTLSAAQIAAGFIDVKFNPTADNTDFKVTASIVDVAGNAAGPVDDTARIITAPPSEPIVTILEDANNDTWINAAELQGNIDVSVTLPATAVAGDTLLTTVNGVAQAPITITQADILKGSIALPGIASPGDGAKLTVDAQIKDAAGNIGKTGTDSATIDTSIPNGGNPPTVTITEDANDDKLINAAELNGNVDVKIEFDGSKVDIGDTLRVSDGTTTRDFALTATDKANGYLLTDFPAPASGQTITVTSTIFDAAGNTTLPGSDSATIDTSKPNDGFAPVVTITEDANNDGFINRTEAQGDVDVKVAFAKDKVEVGDTVHVSDGSTTKDIVISAADQANGYITTSFPLPADGTPLTVSAFLSDPAGNQSDTGSDYAKVDLSTLQGLSLSITEDANDDGFINATELKDTVGVEIVLPKDAIAGDLITINATGNATQTITLIQPQIDAGKLTVELTAPPNGTKLEVSAQVADPAGNKSNIASDSATINTTAPSLTAQLDPASDSGTKGDNLTNDNTPTIIGVSNPDAKITVTIPSTGEQLSTTADSNGNWQVTPSQALPDGPTAVQVTAVDGIGNSSTTTLPLVIDTTQYANLAVAIAEDENNDGFINLNELKDNDIDVRVALPSGAAAGDTLTVTASGNSTQVVTLTAAQIAAGHVDLAFTPTANNTDFVVTAAIADAAGNAAGPVSDSARLQLSPPDAPLVTIGEDANSDGWINAAELQGNIDVSIGLPPTAAAGDTLLTTVNGVAQPGIVLSASDIANGSVSLPGIANPGEGATLTVTAQIRDVANNLGSIGSNDARIDTTPPAVTAQLDPASDSGTKGDNITNDNTPTISGTGEPGASIVVTLPGTGEILKTTVTPGGTWSVTPSQPLADGPAPIKITATDIAGNTTSTSVDLVIDTGIPNNLQPPAVLIVEDANGDGYINRSEANGNADVRISFAKDQVNVGDVVKASDGTTTREIVISATDKANGYVSTDFPLPADGATLKVTAYIEDSAGNVSNTGSASAIVDLTEFKNLSIAITEDANNDGFINKAELKDNDIDVRVTVPQGAVAGDTLTVTAVGNVDQVFTLTAAQIATGFIDVKFNPTADNTDFKVTASIVDAAGNSAGPVEDSALIVISPPSAPIVSILEDANNDRWINAAELQGNIDVSVTLPATAVAGDTLLTTVNGVAQAPITITQADILKGSIALPGIANPGDGATLTVDAQIRDSAGNVGKTGSDSATIDTSIPNDGKAPTVTITEDANDDALINASELNGNVDVKIEFDGSKVDIGDTLRVSDGTTTRDFAITAADKANGYITTDFPAPASGQTITVTSTIFDAAGNTTQPGSDSATIDTSKPNDGFAPTVTITEDANNDGFINRTEANGNADVKIAFNKDKVEVGDTVRVTDGTTTKDLVISAADKANGYVTTDFAMPTDGSTLNVSAFLFDPAGNKSDSGSDYAKVDLSALQGLTLTITEDANNDGFINASELQGTVGVEIVLPKDAIAGDLITINATGNATQTITLIQPQIDAGKLTVELTAPPNGTRLEVSAQVADAAGNKSNVASDDATIALVSPGAPIVNITEDVNNDGYINAAELQGNIDVSIELPAGTKAGESLLVSVNGVAQAPIVLSAADIANGSISLNFPSPGNGQPFEVSAQVKDGAGNLSPTGIDSATVDTTTFSGLAIAITEDANNDGFINQAELKNDDIDVRVTIPQGAAVGDTLTVTAVGNVDKVFTLTAAQIATGFIDVKFNPTASNTDFKVTASIVDAAGNSAGPVEDSARIIDTLPSEPIVTILEDVNNDTWINAAELQGNIDVSVTLPATAIAGDTLLTTVNGVAQAPITITQADILKGSIALPGIVSPGDGATLTVDAQIRDIAGNVGKIGSDSATIDTSIPNGGNAPTVTITEDANNDGMINAAELSGNVDVKVEFDGTKVDVGDTVHVSDGTSIKNFVITAGDKANGYIVTDFPAPASGQTITVTSYLSDPAGNQSKQGSDAATIDTDLPNDGKAPDVTITEDANNDGFINRAEANGNADVKIAFNKDKVEVGDTVRVTDGTTTKDLVITVADKANGYVTTDFAMPADGSSLNVSAFLFDPAGNKSATGTDYAKVDLSTLQGLTLTITEDANNDGFINATELKGTVGVEIVLPKDAIAGDLITINATGNATQTITLIQPQIDAGKLIVELTAPPNGTKLEVSAQVADAAGNKSNVASDDATIVTDPIGAPTVNITEDANNDGYINAAELQGNIDVSIKLPSGTQAGDSLLVSINGVAQTAIVLSAADIAGGSVNLDFPSPGNDQPFEVTAQVKDFAGNFSPTGSDAAQVDPSVFSGLAIAITEDANDDGYINKAELKDNDIDVRVTIPQGAAVGDTLTVTAAGNVDQVFTLSAAQIAAGFIDVKFNPTADNTDFKVTASIVDAAGNAAGPVDDSARIITAPPSEPIVTILEDANNDTWINAAELQGNIDVSITLPATAVAGDTLLTTVNGVAQAPITITQADILKGSIALPGVASPGDGVKLTVDAQIKDAAGNVGKTGSDSATIDTSIPNDGNPPTVIITEDANNDALISAPELSGNVDVRIEFDGSKVEVGDTLRVSDGVNTKDFVISAADKANGYITTDFAARPAGETITVDAYMFDPAGNVGKTGSDQARFALIQLGDLLATVSEEGLAGGIKDSSGNPGDVADSATASGNIGVTGAGGASLLVSVAPPSEALSADGVQIVWSGSGSSASPLIGTAGQGGPEVLRVTVDSNGNYEIKLSQAIDHAAGQDENVETLHFDLTADDGLSSTQATLTLDIEDDAPKAVPETEADAMRHQDTNILLILDNSGSMAGSRIEILRNSVRELIQSYDMLGDVAVRIVVYSSSAKSYTEGWVSAADAIAYVNALGTGGATNYDAALLKAMEAFQSSGKIPDGTNVAYFLSDGEPNASSDWDGSGPLPARQGIQAEEEALWKSFLETNKINAFAFGMGSDTTQASMNPVAYNGVTKTDTDAVIVANESELGPILRDTVNANFKGNFLDGTLHQGSGVGADGGHLTSFSIDGTTYLLDGTVSGTAIGTADKFDGQKWTVFTDAGGKLVVDMLSGDYIYTPPIKSNATTEQIGFAIIDNDGDHAASTLSLTVTPPPAKIFGGSGDDTLNGGNYGDYIDGKEGNDLIVGGQGDDTLIGGLGADTFKWSLGDQGTTKTPASDVIKDFSAGNGGDVLDLRDLLQGENSGNLTNYLHFSASGSDTLIQISSQGAYTGSNHATATDQTILLQGVALDSLAGAGANDAQIINELLKANLKVDL